MPSRAAAATSASIAFAGAIDRRESRARRRDFRGACAATLFDGAMAHLGEVEMESQAVEQRRRRPLVIVMAFIEGDDPDARLLAGRKSVAREFDLATVERCGDPRRRRAAEALRHGQHEDAAVGLREQAGFGDGPSRAQAWRRDPVRQAGGRRRWRAAARRIGAPLGR